jgi:hypothetical protein
LYHGANDFLYKPLGIEMLSSATAKLKLENEEDLANPLRPINSVQGHFPLVEY